ncbi:YSIRK-type signal peptide-containing protein [Lactobacillus delbrueckii subsp. lactis]|uniref:YSIRK-type signal peptide-containing protein n=1 Tax=Lactobacillus delbrueckii TaxID=1584 RepID=UPI001E2F3900|nr:YSIRK-type signal peptide-containing protein [Lactobacillus delbrueckii]MCD5529838.1 YSIRK-type signal peptide-containing protein [Lactobacillus delbrueckii subsp. lactis]
MSHKHDPNFNSKLNGKEKFGFRKLSIGLAAVALDTSFFVGSGQLVQALVLQLKKALAANLLQKERPLLLMSKSKPL